MYSCNYVHPPEFPGFSNQIHNSKTKEQDTVEAIKKIAYKNNPITINDKDDEVCKCKCAIKKGKKIVNDLMDQGWEGSAILDHGSIVTFGCLNFVFCVVEEFTSR